MDKNDIYEPVIRAAEDSRKKLLDKLAGWDRTIDTIRSNDGSDPAIPFLEEERTEMQGGIDQINRTIERLQNTANGLPAEAGPGEQTKLRPGQYYVIRRLTAAVEAFLAHYPGQGPIEVSKLADILEEGGTTIHIRRGPRKGERDKVRAPHIRIMASGHKTGFKSRKEPNPFVYDKSRDTIRLKTKEEFDREVAELKREKEELKRKTEEIEQSKKGKGRSGSGRKGWGMSLSPQMA